MFIRKHYLNRILPFVDKPVIKVITGLRRVGKSTFLQILKDHLLKKGIPKKNILCINKESLEFDFIIDYQDLNRFIKSSYDSVQGKKYLFIDEIQEISECEKAVVSIFR